MKKKVTKQQRINEKVADILDKMSDRLTSLSNRMGEVESTLDRQWTLNAQRAVIAGNNNEKAEIAINGLINSVQKFNERLGKLESLASQLVDGEAKTHNYQNERFLALEATIRAMINFKVIGYDLKGDFEYIHPLDLAEVIQSKKMKEVVHDKDFDTLLVDGTRYKQSPFVPRKRHNIV